MFDHLKEHIDKAVDMVKNDPQIKEEFKADPVKTLEKVLGVDLPDEQMKAVAEAVKAKVGGGAEGLGDMVKGGAEGLGNMVKGLFHKD